MHARKKKRGRREWREWRERKEQLGREREIKYDPEKEKDGERVTRN